MKRAGGFFGDERKAQRAGSFDCQLAIATVEARDVPDHVHDEAHIVLAIDRGYISAARNEVPTEAPFTFIYNPPGTDHRDRFVETGTRFFAVEIGAEYVREVDARRPVEIVDQSSRARMTGLAVAVSRAEGALDNEERLFDILASLGDYRGETGSPPWLRRCHDAIRELHSCEHISVEQLAREADVHPVHLSRSYRRIYGMGPAEAILRARAEVAMAAMAGPASLADLALLSGFSDQAHLSRSFQRFYGATPKKVRAALR